MPSEFLLDTVKFLFELTDIQIKKYKALTVIGVGPDAGMNAKLVADEVRELLGFLERLLKMLNAEYYKENDLSEIFSQIQFYMYQEWLRGHAAWLVDENNVHNPEYKRLVKQQLELTAIAQDAKVDASLSLEPKTVTQRQCEHDSNAIAFLVLKAALDQKKAVEDPEFSPDLGVTSVLPRHALNILKRHAQVGGRYWQPEFAEPILEVYQACSKKLESSSLDKCDKSLTYEEALIQEKSDRSLFELYLSTFKAYAPASPLFESDHKWYSIGSLEQRNSKEASLVPAQDGAQRGLVARNQGLFLFGSFMAVSISMLIYWVCQDPSGILGDGRSSFRPN